MTYLLVFGHHIPSHPENSMYSSNIICLHHGAVDQRNAGEDTMSQDEGHDLYNGEVSALQEEILLVTNHRSIQVNYCHISTL